ncbi:MAG: hypothetical protein DWQ19_09340 [Crenarchaeota archaeon]|nr:MAG: hypothetical protein DWQ19_09340 [Thermoproteota archaeon]
MTLFHLFTTEEPPFSQWFLSEIEANQAFDELVVESNHNYQKWIKFQTEDVSTPLFAETLTLEEVVFNGYSCCGLLILVLNNEAENIAVRTVIRETTIIED